jgi:putative pyruvate formate lyase activating enzyme
MWKLQRPDALAVLEDRLAQRSLARYFAVMQNRKPAKFLIAKKIQANFDMSDATEQLWQEHTKLSHEFSRIQREVDDKLIEFEAIEKPEKSYMDLKIEIARRIMSSCHLCARKCGVNRLKGNRGYCGCGSRITVSGIFGHLGEEPELVPSGTVFTLGCTMRCKHCQNWAISQWAEKANIYKPKHLAREVEQLRVSGCRNANLVGGEPTPWLQQWLHTFKHVDINIPVVWNSNSYYSPESATLLAEFADVYLLDFKYGPGQCAKETSDAQDYWETCLYNHLEAKRHGELIIRILVLPNHLECCAKPIVDWIGKNLGVETRVNIMFQYKPEWKAIETPESNRGLTRHEMQRAIQLARKANLSNFIT